MFLIFIYNQKLLLYRTYVYLIAGVIKYNDRQGRYVNHSRPELFCIQSPPMAGLKHQLHLSYNYSRACYYKILKQRDSPRHAQTG